MTLTIAVNCDTQDLAYGSSGVDWVDIDLDNDYIVFSNGSDVVKDGEALPSSSDLNQAGIVITDSAQIIPHYFLADANANLLKEIHNAGNQKKQYVFAFSFDGATVSEPVLEVWDDSDMDSTNDYSLGEGTPSNSWIWGLTTTDSAPGNNWLGTSPTEGSRLAGSSDGHFLWLNNENGSLSGAKVLYCQLKIIVPANFANAGAETPVFVIKYATN